MYGEIGRAAEISAARHWPLPESLRVSNAIGVAPVLALWLEPAGWQKKDGGWELPGQKEGERLDLTLDFWGWSADRDQTGHLAAQILALSLLGRAYAALRKTIGLAAGEPARAEGEPLVLRPGWNLTVPPGGLLIAPSRMEEAGTIALPDSSFFWRARQSLLSAGFHPGLRLYRGSDLKGLSFIAPGHPDRALAEMAGAAAAYASLIYGLAGYGVMAFQFDLDF